MEGTLVYDAARDAAWQLSVGTIGSICVVAGVLLLSIPIVRTIRRSPEKRVRGIVGLVVLVGFGLAVGIGGPMLEASTLAAATPETIEGVIGDVTPKLFTVGGMRVMISCADAARCPGVNAGDYARVAYVDESGPETDALATKIWKLPHRGSVR